MSAAITVITKTICKSTFGLSPICNVFDLYFSKKPQKYHLSFVSNSRIFSRGCCCIYSFSLKKKSLLQASDTSQSMPSEGGLFWLRILCFNFGNPDRNGILFCRLPLYPTPQGTPTVRTDPLSCIFKTWRILSSRYVRSKSEKSRFLRHFSPQGLREKYIYIYIFS